MTPESYTRLKATLRDAEDVRAKPYDDATGHELKPGDRLIGKVTVGCGRNLSDVSLSPDEEDLLLSNDIARAFAVANAYPWFAGLDAVRKRTWIELAFNMGAKTLADFHDTRLAMARGDYHAAADHLTRSKWFRQVGRRGPRVVAMLRTGLDPH
jgi:GH24 family phage-related lysozyme (muramidase)